MTDKTNLTLDVALEQAVLGAAFLSPDSLPQIADILVTASEATSDPVQKFALAPHKRLWEVLTGLHERGLKIDETAVLAALHQRQVENPQGLLYGVVATATGFAGAGESHAQQLLELWQKRETIYLMEQQLAKMRGTPPEQTHALWESAQREQANVFLGRDAKIAKLTTWKDSLNTYFDTLEARQLAGETAFDGVPSGFKPLDDLTLGYVAGGLHVWGAPSGGGKSVMLLNQIRNMVELGYRVLFFSLEMSYQEHFDRLFAGLLDVDSKHVRLGNLKDHEWERFVNTYNRVGNWSGSCHWHHQPGTTVNDVLRITDYVASRYGGVDIVVADYLQILGLENRPSNDIGYYEAVVTKLKELADTRSIPVLAAAQLNRKSAADKTPSLQSFHGASIIERTASTASIFFPVEEGEDFSPVPRHTPHAAKTSLVEVHLVKNRHMDKGQFELVWNKATSVFYVPKKLELNP